MSDWGDILTNFGSPFSPLSGFGAKTSGALHANSEYGRLLFPNSPKFGKAPGGQGIGNASVQGRRGGALSWEEGAQINEAHALGEEESMSMGREVHGGGKRDGEDAPTEGRSGSGVTEPK